MPSWAKMASNLDSHPKIREAGAEGREVFLYALRRNAELNFNGIIPAIHLQPKWIAVDLMIDESRASLGLSRSVTAGLLVRDKAFFVIKGWDNEWAKRPLTDVERKAKQRAKTKTGQQDTNDVTNGHEAIVTPRDGHGSEKRREENIHQPAVNAFDAYFKLTHNGDKPTWNGPTVNMVKRLVAAHGCAEVEKRIAALTSDPPNFPPSPWDLRTFVGNFDKLAGKSARSKHRAPEPPPDEIPLSPLFRMTDAGKAAP